MASCWRAALLGELQAQLGQGTTQWEGMLAGGTAAEAAPTASHGMAVASCRSPSAWQQQEQQQTSLPVLLHGLLLCLPRMAVRCQLQQVAANAPLAAAATMPAAANRSPLAEQQHQQQGAHDDDVVLDPHVVDLLQRLLSRLLLQSNSRSQPAAGGQMSDGASEMMKDPVGAIGSMDGCRAVVQQLLWRYHVVGELLGWLLQNEAAARQICAAAAAAAPTGGQVAAADTPGHNSAQQSAAESIKSPRIHLEQEQQQGQLVAAAAAGVAAADAAEPGMDPAAAAVSLPAAVLRLAEQLQQLQAVQLPIALQQLLAAQTAAAAAAVAAGAHNSTLAGEAIKAMPLSAAAALTVDASPSGAGAGTSTVSGKKRKRGSSVFYIVNTPQQQQQQQQHTPGSTGAAGGTAPTAAAATGEGGAAAAGCINGCSSTSQSTAGVPAWLLQLPQLPVPACRRLLAAAWCTLQARLELQLQLQAQQAQGTPHGVPVVGMHNMVWYS